MKSLSVTMILLLSTLAASQPRPSPVAPEPRFPYQPPGPWPAELTFPEKMGLYKRSAWTQEIAVTNNRDRISPVPRLRLERKWQVPGGTENVRVPIRSDLYAWVAPDSEQWVGSIDVLNSLGSFQPNRGWKRRFGNGTVFADVLSVGGKAFTVRYLEKIDGKWEASVAFNDESLQPKGFVPFRPKHCFSCHAEAGSGGYGMGLVPGGDSILSYPFAALER